MKNQEQDLTIGNVNGKLVRFALPLFGANLLQSFYSIVDMLVVGRIVGKTGLAAISNASMISFIINSICIGVIFYCLNRCYYYWFTGLYSSFFAS